jgi:hypothetical protein
MPWGEDREEWEAASEQRVRRVSDLKLLRGFVGWVLEGGIELIARSTNSAMNG